MRRIRAEHKYGKQELSHARHERIFPARESDYPGRRYYKQAEYKVGKAENESEKQVAVGFIGKDEQGNKAKQAAFKIEDGLLCPNAAGGDAQRHQAFQQQQETKKRTGK